LSKTIANNAIQLLQGLKQQVTEYESLLESNLGEVRAAIDILRKQVRIMLDRVSLDNGVARIIVGADGGGYVSLKEQGRM